MTTVSASDVYKRQRYQFPENIEFIVYEMLFENFKEKVYEIEAMREVDIFVASGSNYKNLSRTLKQLPLVEVSATGLDLLNAIQKAGAVNKKIAVITLGKRINYLAPVKEIINAEIHEFTYQKTSEVDNLLKDIYKMGIEHIISSAFVIERAQLKGMEGQLIWSMDGIEGAIQTAISIVESRNKDNEKAKKLNSILQFSHEGIIVTDKDCLVTDFNKRAEIITGIKAVDIIGYHVEDKLINTKLPEVIKEKKQMLNEIQQIGDVKVLTNRTPIIYGNEVIGSIAAFQNISAINEAENIIKRSLYNKGFIAKTRFQDIIGDSIEIQSIKEISRLYARTESSVLIYGESGTGKDLLAQSIHNESLRSEEPFVAINCAVISGNLLESELFGYEEGAFTGAKKGGKMGIFEIANKGTIFLDEIGDLSLEIQPKLLRVLEQGQFLRVGGEKIIHTDVRVLAATNANLWELIQDGGFREDLFYRLNVLEIESPPLRKRKSDIPMLIKHFISHFRPDLPPEEIQKIAQIQLFYNYDWPGNIRELRNVIERFSVLYRDGEDINLLAEKILIVRSSNQISINEKDRILKILEENNWNKSESSEKLGISRTTLWRKLKEYGIED